MIEIHPPLAPAKHGHTHEVIIVCRVSNPGPGKQDIRSLDDQQSQFTEPLNKACGPGKYKVTLIAGSGSGELLDRAEYRKLEDLIESGRIDLVLCEDLGRIARRVQVHGICEACEDRHTRLIAPNDRVDTASPSWREASLFAAFHHERSNRDTSDRIKRTQRNRFQQGGVLRQATHGWIKPPGAKNDSQLTKDPAAEPIYIEWFRVYDEDNATHAEIARWLKKQGIKFAPRVDGQYADPTVASVARHMNNPLLKGVRERNRRKTRRINNPGKYVSEKAAPEELLSRHVPHLAFFEPAYYDRVVAKIKARNSIYRRAKDGQPDPRLHVPKRQTRYPGQCVFCGVCGRNFVWGGHGQTDHLMCNGARLRSCWNGASFDGTFAACKIASAVYAAVENLQGFDQAFLQSVNDEANRLDSDREHQRQELTKRVGETDRAIQRFVKFIRAGDESPSVRDELRQSESEKVKLQSELAMFDGLTPSSVTIPEVEELKIIAREALRDLPTDGEGFARLFRRLVPRIVVFPVQLCDGGHIVLRAKLKLHLATVLHDSRACEVLDRPMAVELTLNLFDPPQREVFRERVVVARKARHTERQIAADLGITITAAQRAMAL